MASRSHPAYGRFARYYDIIYHGLVNYEGDVDFLEAVFRRYRAKPKTILDLGCGTGNHDIPLARRGYRVTGLDQSSAMLSVARKKTAESRVRVRFVRADMRSFRLGKQLDAVLCLFGAFGYILPGRDIVRVLRSVRGHLGSGGLFIFEFWQGSAARPAPHQSWHHIRRPDLEIVRLDESRYDPRTGRLPSSSGSSSSAADTCSIGLTNSTRFRPTRSPPCGPCYAGADSTSSERLRRRM